jgi:hypothetical protein
VPYKRSKVIRDAQARNSSSCPPPCGKIRFLTRAAARKAARRIQGETGGKLRAYSGDEARYQSCKGFFHLASYDNPGRRAFYREARALAAEQGFPEGWTAGITQEGRRWRYTVYVAGEEPMPSVYTYASAEIAQREAIADILSESRAG